MVQASRGQTASAPESLQRVLMLVFNCILISILLLIMMMMAVIVMMATTVIMMAMMPVPILSMPLSLTGVEAGSVNIRVCFHISVTAPFPFPFAFTDWSAVRGCEAADVTSKATGAKVASHGRCADTLAVSLTIALAHTMRAQPISSFIAFVTDATAAGFAVRWSSGTCC